MATRTLHWRSCSAFVRMPLVARLDMLTVRSASCMPCGRSASGLDCRDGDAPGNRHSGENSTVVE